MDRYVGKTWEQVLEENEWFDGEVEIAAAARQAWREANRRASLAALSRTMQQRAKAR